MYAAGNGHALAVEALLKGGADAGQVNPQVRIREWAVRWVVGVWGGVWEGGGLIRWVVWILVLLSSQWGARGSQPTARPRHFPAPH
jgi:hypothetical protein